ncbi:fungal-specific transcription factor domain-containing protein [Lipomyces kononenkoae]|uniref:Fungal-specific transcription factor domain-containing protein n=1 Tax=Lipomyces kononenkoae TaxID=34357 RepID=A0ACC3T2D5_LIPKO
MSLEPVREPRKCRPNHQSSQRAPIACIRCRQRKIRCSSGWPSCRRCITRSLECRYPGIPQISSALGFAIEARTSTGPSDQNPVDFSDLSFSERHRAAEFFSDNFGSTLLFFFDPLNFTSKYCAGEFPRTLTWAIIALTARLGRWKSVDESNSYYRKAQEMLRTSEQELSLYTIQAYLVHCVYEIGCGLESRAWLHLGNAIRMAQILRLHIMDKPRFSFDWGLLDEATDEDTTTREIKRRTFWSCFFLDKLLSNGRDRPSGIYERDVFCYLPVSHEDFIFRRFHQSWGLHDAHLCPGEQRSLYMFLIQILSILGEIISWHGKGGRFLNASPPWEKDMPFTVLDDKLNSWRAQIPDHLRYSVGTFSALSLVSASQLKIWGLMHSFFFLAKTYLHREYLPFVPPKNYLPFAGPYSLSSIPQDWGIPPEGWWKKSVTDLLDSSKSITELVGSMTKHFSTFPSIYPFMGLCLMTSASIHALFTTVDDKDYDACYYPSSPGTYLHDDIESMDSIGLFWDIAKAWVNQIDLYRVLLDRSQKGDQSGSEEGFKSLVDGIMNYIRESQGIREDRVQRVTANSSNQDAVRLAGHEIQQSMIDPSTIVSRGRARSNLMDERVPSQAQIEDGLEWPGLSDEAVGQHPSLNIFSPGINDQLEGQIESLTNWDYFHFS